MVVSDSDCGWSFDRIRPKLRNKQIRNPKTSKRVQSPREKKILSPPNAVVMHKNTPSVST